MFDTIAAMARALRVPSLRERELAYLHAAEDRFDLEYRERQIDRGLFRDADARLMATPGSH